MSDEGVIRIGTEVDISGLKANMAEAASTVKASTSEMDAAFERVAASTAEYAVVSANLRAVIRQLVDGSVPYSLAVKSLTPALMEQTNAAKALAAAKESLAVVSKAEAGAQEQVAGATRNVTSSYYAAQGAAGLLEGRIPFRAMERFIASSSTASNLLMAAFPVIGAVALGGVLIDVTEKVIQFSNDAAALGRELGSGWMDGALAQLSGLSKGIKQADDEIMKLAHDNDEVRNRMQEDAVDAVRLTQGDAAATWFKAGQIQKQIDALEGLKQAHLKSAQAIEKEINSQGELDRVGSLGIENLRKQQEVAVAQYNSALKEQIELIQRKNNLFLQAQQDQQRQDQRQEKHETAGENQAARKAAEAERKADEEAIQAARETLESLKAAHAMTAVEESQYWAGLAFEAQFGSKQYTTFLDEANRATATAQQESSRILTEWNDTAREQFSEQIKEAERMKKNQEELASAVQDEGERITAAHQSAATAVQEATLRAEEASGAISRFAAAQKQARIHAQAYREELERLDAEISKVTEDESLTPQQRAQKMGELQSQKIQVQGQQQTTSIADQAAIQQQMVQPYVKAFNQINDAWLQVANQMMYSTRNIGLAFAKMGQGLAISAIDGLERMGVAAIEASLMIKSSQEQQALSSAKLAFKNTYATVSGWPYVGPILAPILAAAAFTAVAAFEDGTAYVPQTGMALLHEGEAVIPAGVADRWRDGEGPGGGDVNIHQQNNWNTMTDRQFQKQLYRHAQHVAGAVQRHLRQAGRG